MCMHLTIESQTVRQKLVQMQREVDEYYHSWRLQHRFVRNEQIQQAGNL